jgi:hypothetical protein
MDRVKGGHVSSAPPPKPVKPEVKPEKKWSENHADKFTSFDVVQSWAPLHEWPELNQGSAIDVFNNLCQICPIEVRAWDRIQTEFDVIFLIFCVSKLRPNMFLVRVQIYFCIEVW